MPCCWSSIRLLTWWSDSESEPPPLWLLPEYGAPASSPKLRILRLFLFWSVLSRADWTGWTLKYFYHSDCWPHYSSALSDATQHTEPRLRPRILQVALAAESPPRPAASLNTGLSLVTRATGTWDWSTGQSLTCRHRSDFSWNN